MSARYWPIPFGTTGDKTPIPNTLQPDGAVSAPIGWGPNYEKAKTEAGYLPVSRKYTNQLAFDITSGLKDLQDFGVPAYYPEAAPYAINSIVRHGDKVWRSAIVNNNSVPGVNTDWADTTLTDYLNRPRVTVASAPTVDLTTTSPNSRNIVITGAAAISSFTIGVGNLYFCTFAGPSTLVNSASIVTNTGLDIKVGAGDSCIIRATVNNVIEVLCYSRAPLVVLTDNTTDLNAIFNPGPYPMLIGAVAGSRNPNHPDGQTAPAAGNGVANFYWLEVKKYGYSGNVMQIAYPYLSGADTTNATIKYRFVIPGSVSPWRSIPSMANLPFARQFISSPQTITSGGGLTIAHGLGIAPFFVQLELICTTADAGYSPGDRLQRPAGGGGMGGGSSIEVWPDAININVRFGNATYSVANKTTGAQTSLTLTSWSAVLRAFV